MNANLGYEGFGELSVTMKLNAATVTAIGQEYDKAVGKTVTITGNNEVGFGTEGNPIYGIIAKVEKNGLATIVVKGFKENVAISATAAKQPAAGNGVAVDGVGGLVKADVATVTVYGIAIAVDVTAKTATIFMK